MPSLSLLTAEALARAGPDDYVLCPRSAERKSSALLVIIMFGGFHAQAQWKFKQMKNHSSRHSFRKCIGHTKNPSSLVKSTKSTVHHTPQFKSGTNQASGYGGARDHLARNETGVRNRKWTLERNQNKSTSTRNKVSKKRSVSTKSLKLQSEIGRCKNIESSHFSVQSTCIPHAHYVNA